MKSKQFILLLFCCVLSFLPLFGQKRNTFFAETGVDLILGDNMYSNTTVLAATLGIGIKRTNWTSGLRFTSSISPLQPSWQKESSLDYIIPSTDISLLPVPSSNEFIHTTTNILSKYEHLNLFVHRKKEHRAGYVEVQGGVRHFRPHTASAIDFFIRGVGQTSFPVFSKSLYEVRSKWRLHGAVGIGYEFNNLDFSLHYLPYLRGSSLGILYKYFFAEKTVQQVESGNDVRINASLGYSSFYGLSPDKSSGANALITEFSISDGSYILGISGGQVLSTTGFDQKELPSFIKETNSFSVPSQFDNNPFVYSAFLGKNKQLSQKESWYYAVGGDLIRLTDEKDIYGLQTRLGWQANMWSGAVVYHLPFSNNVGHFLEYKIAIGLDLTKPILHNF